MKNGQVLEKYIPKINNDPRLLSFTKSEDIPTYEIFERDFFGKPFFRVWLWWGCVWFRVIEKECSGKKNGTPSLDYLKIIRGMEFEICDSFERICESPSTNKGGSYSI